MSNFPVYTNYYSSKAIEILEIMKFPVLLTIRFSKENFDSYS